MWDSSIDTKSALVQHQYITSNDEDPRRHMAWLDQDLNDLHNELDHRRSKGVALEDVFGTQNNQHTR